MLGAAVRVTAWMRAGLRAVALLFSLAGALTACSGGGEGAAEGTGASPLIVVATTTQVGDFARRVAGDRAAVRTLVKANQDPHAFEPTPGDVAAVARSGIIFKSGAGLDDWLDGVLRNAGGSRPIVDLSRSAELRTADGEADPHYWLDATNVEALIPAVRDALSAADPGGAASYATNAAAYLAELRTLDREIMALVASIPAERRKFVADHDAFRYFTERYGLNFVGSVLRGLSTDREPTPGQLIDLINLIRTEAVPVIFTERSLNPKLEQELAAEAGIRVVSTLYGDGLGAPGSGADTYLGMMRSNAREIVEALR